MKPLCVLAYHQSLHNYVYNMVKFAQLNQMPMKYFCEKTSAMMQKKPSFEKISPSFGSSIQVKQHNKNVQNNIVIVSYW